MTNYTRFPKWRYNNGTIVISFSFHNYSWCVLNKSDLKYLLHNYCDDADCIFVRYFNGQSFKLSVSDFRACIKEDYSFDFIKANQIVDATRSQVTE